MRLYEIHCFLTGKSLSNSVYNSDPRHTGRNTHESDINNNKCFLTGKSLSDSDSNSTIIIEPRHTAISEAVEANSNSLNDNKCFLTGKSLRLSENISKPRHTDRNTITVDYHCFLTGKSLTESDTDLSPKIVTDSSVESLLAYIRLHCQPWLEKSNNLSLAFYRGIRSFSYYEEDSPEAYIRRVRDNRDPLNTSPQRHQIFNALIQAAGGTANRSNSLFVTSNFQEARSYSGNGDVYAVIPIGQFDYTWSPTWDDWTANAKGEQIESALIDQTLRAHPNKREFLVRPDSYSPDLVRKFVTVNDNLRSAASLAHEVMIKCDSALFLRPALFNAIRDSL